MYRELDVSEGLSAIAVRQMTVREVLLKSLDEDQGPGLRAVARAMPDKAMVSIGLLTGVEVSKEDLAAVIAEHDAFGCTITETVQ